MAPSMFDSNIRDFLLRPAIIVPAVILISSIVVISDYRAWLAFGTGGTPANFKGYLRINSFRFKRLLSSDSLTDTSKLSAAGASYIKGYLRQRAGPRPKVLGRTLPQRQQPAYLDKAVQQRLHALPAKYAEEHTEILKLDLSNTEGRSTDAIYGTKDGENRAFNRVLGNEIAHVHPAENSLHVWLTVADAKKVVDAGWGERFPLSSLGLVHDGWTFVYAPRSMEEVDVIEDIVKAGIAHLTGCQVD